MVFLVAQDRGLPGFDEIHRHLERVALETSRHEGYRDVDDDWLKYLIVNKSWCWDRLFRRQCQPLQAQSGLGKVAARGATESLIVEEKDRFLDRIYGKGSG